MICSYKIQFTKEIQTNIDFNAFYYSTPFLLPKKKENNHQNNQNELFNEFFSLL
jgi:hypothetical protein